MSNQTNANKITTDMIPDGEVMLVSGTVEFSHIRSRLEGKELEDDNARKVKNGMLPEEKPHTRISISQASVMHTNPGVKSMGEQYIEGRLFVSPKHPQKGMCYEGKSKSNQLPGVYSRSKTDPEELQELIPDGELASGQRVTLVLKCFGAQQGKHKGVALEGVICEEEPRYFTGGMSSSTLADLQNRGFKIKPVSAEVIEANKNKLASAAASAGASPAPNSYGVNYAAATPSAVPTPPVYGTPSLHIPEIILHSTRRHRPLSQRLPYTEHLPQRFIPETMRRLLPEA